MSYLVLARKYRPQAFDQVVKQEHVTQTLVNAISSKRVAHAIVFSGPRGTGKTTIARILAKAMNCTNNKKDENADPNPCNACRSCKEITAGNSADVFEIDGASNNSVDQVRELRGNIKYMPVHSPYKIYIIDEVHMLSLAAFNALLKTLEEPPDHIMFMFATTEPNKIPITILSRCQRHDLRRISLEAISGHMATLCGKETIEISNESLELIAREAGGSMRDALSLLDQVISCCDGTVDHTHILNVLGVIDRKIIFDISEALLTGEIPEILNILDGIYAGGHDIKILYSNLIEHFRNLLVVKMGKMVNKLVDVPAHEVHLMQEQVKNISHTLLSQILDILFKEEAAVKFSAHPKIALEMVFIRMFSIKPALSIDTLIQKFDTLGKELFNALPEKANRKSVPLSEQPKTFEKTVEPVEPAVSRLPDKPAPAHDLQTAEPISDDPDTGKDPIRNKKELFAQLIEKHPSLKGTLHNSRLKKKSDDHIVFEINGGDFHINMMNRKKAVLEEISSEFFGKKITITIEAKTDSNPISKGKKEETRPLKNGAFNHPLVADAIEIFNAKVVDIKTL